MPQGQLSWWLLHLRLALTLALAAPAPTSPATARPRRGHLRLGAAICAALVFTIGMTVITVRGARDPADK